MYVCMYIPIHRQLICRSPNIEEVGLSSLITSYNGTPTVIKKTASVHCGQGYVEIDVNTYLFATLARHSIHSVLSR